MITRRAVKSRVWASIDRQFADRRPRSLVDVGTGILVLLFVVWLLFH